MTHDEICAELYFLWHQHMGADRDSWRRDTDEGVIPAGVAASIVRQAKWVQERIGDAASGHAAGFQTPV